jgi:hypothetical protein
MTGWIIVVFSLQVSDLDFFYQQSETAGKNRHNLGNSLFKGIRQTGVTL